jgi:hypothetical protein
VSFTTRPAVEIGATWATEVGTDAARLQAEVNPLTVQATGRFEYVEDATYQADQPNGFEHAESTSPLDFGSGEALLVRSAQLTGLQPGTTYHYRLVASNRFFPSLTSAPATLTTFASPGASETSCLANQAFRTGPSAALPDCRAYELVSPVDKANGDVITRLNVTGYPTALDQSSVAGSGFTYSSYHAFADPQSAPYTNQVLALRHERGESEEGWQNESIDPLRGGPGILTNEIEDAYKAFLPELDQGWLLQETEPTLDPCAPVGFADLYHRDNSSGAYRALSCSPPSTHAPVLPASKYSPELQGFSADGSHAVFRVDNALESSPTASGATVNESEIRPIHQLYESSGDGDLHLVSVLPNGNPSGSDSSVGTAFNNLVFNHNRLQIITGAVSNSGTRIFWSTGGQVSEDQLYLRINADQDQSTFNSQGECKQPTRACTIPVSATVSPEDVRFQGGNTQGTKALFIVTSGPLEDDLYEFDSEAEPAPASHLIAKGLRLTEVNGVDRIQQQPNILGASEDLSRIYFASEEATPSQQLEGAVEGEPNIYLYDEGTTRFVGALSFADLGNPYGKATALLSISRTARVSPNGQSLVFMSNSRDLSEETAGYDNTDVISGKADAEIYLYDATADEGEGKLRCLSCNPSGARPRGRELLGFGGENAKDVDGWAAARIPAFETQFYQPRYLSDDGHRVFFDSYDSLVLGDTNGREDVYQWEAAGTGGCRSESPSYAAASGGCLSLLSSGQSPADSEFLDASPAGSDVFFTTAEGLLPQDPGLIDAYDARVNGGFLPPRGLPASCEGEACQSPPVALNDPSPASGSGEFAGNVKEKPKSRCAKGKARKAGKCVAKKRKQAKRAHRRAANRTRRAAR